MYILEFIKRKFVVIVSVFIAGILALSAYLYVPTANKNVIDKGIYSEDTKILLAMIIIFFISLVLSQMFIALKEILITYVENLYSLFIRRNIHKKIRNIEDIEKYSTSQLISYHINDVNVAKQKFRILLDNVISVLEILLVCIIVATIEYKFLIIITLIIPVYAIMPKVLGKKITLSSIQVQNQLEKITERITNSYNMSSEIRIFQKETWDYNETDNQFKKIIKPVVKLSLYNNLFVISNLFYSAFLCLVFYFGAILVKENDITIGTLFALTTYIGYISAPVQAIAYNIGQLKNIAVSENRIKEVYQSTDITERKYIDAHIDYSNIKFEHVEFNINNTQILNSISFEINLGDFFAISGISGSGKTSILNIIARLTNPTNGKVLINNVDIETIQHKDYFNHICYIFQESKFFDGTLLENLFIDQDEYKKIELLKELLVIFELDSLINSLDFMIENNGSNLSGGQKQRLNTIRGILRNTPILLLDEVTSGIESELAIKVMRYIKYLRKDQITLFISHDPNIINMATKKINIHKGSLVLDDKLKLQN